MHAQTRNRSLVAWGETLLGLNRAPELPGGVSASDVEEVSAGEVVTAVTLRSGIAGYTGSRLILRGPALLTGSSDGTISYGSGTVDYTDKTLWNTALQGSSGVMSLDRVGFGHLFGALIRKPTGSPVAIASGRFKDQFPGDLAFFGDRVSAGLPATDTDTAGKFVSVVSSSTHVLALRADGTVKAFGGDNLFGELLIPSGVVGAIEVAVGEFFSAALLSNGQVIVWGSDAFGVVVVPTVATNVISLRAGASHLVALRADGTVVAWGNSADGRTSVPAGLSRVTKIAAGRAHSLALRDDGTVVAWGYNGAGQTSVPSGLVNVVDIAAGGQHNLVLVSREKPQLDVLSVSETSSQGVRDFNPASDYTDRGRTLMVRATLVNAAPPIQFRWRRNGAVISGATNAQLTLTVAAADVGSIRIDAEAINAFGSDMESASIKLAEMPSEVAADAASYVLSPLTIAVLGRTSSGVYLSVENSSQLLAFNVTAKGEPTPRVNVYDAKTGQSVAVETLMNLATATVSQTITVPTTRSLVASSSGSYWVVVGNSLGKTVTNVVTVGIHQDLSVNPPTVSTSYSPNAAVSSVIGPVPAGATNLTLSVVSSHGLGVAYQWLKDGVEILRATNSVLALTNFSFPQMGAYKVRLTNPLSDSSFSADKAKGSVDSGVFNPVLPISVNLSRNLISGLTGTQGNLEIQLTGSRFGKVQLEKLNESNGSWSDASSTFPVIVPGLPAAWSGGAYELAVSANGGNASFTVGTSSLQPSMSGSYRIQAVQLATSGGTELAGTTVTAAFQVAVSTAAGLSLPSTAPAPIAAGGTWISGAVSGGVDMTVAAGAYSTADLSSYLTVSGFPAPVFRWERQTEAAVGSVPAKYQTIVAATNTSRLLLSAVPTNAGIYRVTATNSVGGVTGISKTIAFRVDRVLRIPDETLVAVGGLTSELKTNAVSGLPFIAEGLPISLLGFGDESVLSFTLKVSSPYLLENNSGVTVDLDPSFATTCNITSTRLGTVTPAPANGGVGGNQIKLQVFISRKDPAQTSFPRGTNVIARLYLRAQTQVSIETIRTLGSSGVPQAPALRVPIQILKDSELLTADKDLSFRVAFTNATIAPSTFEGGDVVVLADSVEGDVNNSGSADVVDITSIASVLAASTFTDSNLVTRRRMDCAPRESYGDWAINLADLVQVARYAAKLDATQAAQDPLVGGPSYTLNRSQRPAAAKSLPRTGATEPVRSINFGWSDLVTGQEAWVPVVLNGVGNENAFAFNVEFDPKALEFIGLRAPNGTSSMENRTAAAAGRIGAVVWKQAGQSAPAGSSVIMEVGFRVRAQGGSTELRFGSLPLDALIATVDAKPVQRIQYAASQLSIGQRRRVLGGRVVGQTLAGSQWRLELQAIDSAGAVVSARDRRLRVRTSDRLEAPPTQWQDSGVVPELTPLGNVRIPLNLDPTRASGFFHLVEE